MKAKKIFGVLTLLTGASMITLAILLWLQGAMFKAVLAKSAMFNLTALIGCAGLYLIESQQNINRRVVTGIKLFALIMVIFGFLVSFNIVDFKETWNLLLGIGIIYITFIQLQLLHWERSKNLLKLTGLLTVLSNAFIAIFFFTRLSSNSFGLIFDIVIIISVFSFLVGLILKRYQDLKNPA